MTEHQRIVAAIESSRVFSIADRAVLWVSRIAAESRAGQSIRSTREWVGALPTELARFGLGTALVVAAATHALVMLLLGSGESWLWPVLPFAAVVIGAILLLFSTAPGAGRPAE